ncbi:GPP34 family phosphoprotein [Modestobacter italicus]|uniref:GPP34 family phosphoprotein n=1 Tax=Modestobacter italicus (strain DSM 44449 / CECT 9708 / BC 501) TaxID=2732864 RepID=UPI001C95D476|nr:GPP34 family phosphoprotein [Modestobacter italicus]
MQLTDGVAARLAAVCLDRRGRLRDYDIWDAAARGALLVDLVHAGRLVDADDGLALTTDPTGFLPADALLTAVAAEPGEPLDRWIDHGPVGMRDVAESCAAAGSWTARRGLLGTRYAAPAPVDPDAAVAAAVVVLTRACGADGRRPEPVSDDELGATGDLRWICQAVTDRLAVVHRRYLGSAGAADGGSVPYY